VNVSGRFLFGLMIALGAFALAACDPAPLPITEQEFERGTLDSYVVAQPTALAFGPDGRLYVASLDGAIDALTLNGTEVSDVEVVSTADENEQILGLAVRMEGAGPAVYFSENLILGGSNGDPFPNRIVRVAGERWGEREVVISGLPVSGHNHGTNALAFGGNGRLFIAQGGTTSSGAPSEPDDARWLGWDETPLSGAILVADIDGDGFDGAVTYDRQEASADTNQIGGDVRPWSTGHRNTFGFVIHSNGHMYSLDNGSSEPLPASRDCDTLEAPPDNDPDQLNLVVEGEYFGHPNRNRGRENPEECVFVSPEMEDRDEAPNMLTLVPPSSNSIIEFRSEVFDGEWDGDLIFAWWTGGEIRRLTLSPDGKSIEDRELVAADLGLPIAMAQAADGTIFIAEFSGKISYLKPLG